MSMKKKQDGHFSNFTTKEPLGLNSGKTTIDQHFLILPTLYGATPFKDFGKVCHRGRVNFQMHKPFLWYLD